MKGAFPTNISGPPYKLDAVGVAMGRYNANASGIEVCYNETGGQGIIDFAYNTNTNPATELNYQHRIVSSSSGFQFYGSDFDSTLGPTLSLVGQNVGIAGNLGCDRVNIGGVTPQNVDTGFKRFYISNDSPTGSIGGFWFDGYQDNLNIGTVTSDGATATERFHFDTSGNFVATGNITASGVLNVISGPVSQNEPRLLKYDGTLHITPPNTVNGFYLTGAIIDTTRFSSQGVAGGYTGFQMVQSYDSNTQSFYHNSSGTDFNTWNGPSNGLATRLSLSADSANRYYANGEHYFLNYSGNQTQVHASNVTTTSDDRLKHNEEQITDALSIINKINIYKYDKTEVFLDADYNGDLSDYVHSKEIGIIAQDLLNIPELEFTVNEPKNHTDSSGVEHETPYSVAYNNIHCLALKAIQELSAENEILKNQVAELVTRVTALESSS